MGREKGGRERERLVYESEFKFEGIEKIILYEKWFDRITYIPPTPRSFLRA